MGNDHAQTSRIGLGSWPARLRGKLGPGLLIAGAIAFAAAEPGRAGQALVFSGRSLLAASPAIAFGILLSASITASGSMAAIAAVFRGHPLRMILLAAFVGAVAPVCGVTVLPLVAGLLVAGVPLAPIMAFWLSSPVTDPGMLAVTARTLGLSFAIGKAGAAFGAGIIGGGVAWLLTRTRLIRDPARLEIAKRLADSSCSCGGSDRIAWRFWQEPERRSLFAARALSLAKLISLWLFVAFIAEHFLRDLLPPGLLGSVVGRDQAAAVPLAALVGAPIYLDGYAALPLVRGLMDAGMGPGAAMSFLVAGGIISAWAAVPVLTLVRPRVFALYVALATVSAMLAGWMFGAIVR